MKMEKALLFWLQDCYRKKLGVTTTRMQSQACRLYKKIVDESDIENKDDYKFSGSRGWLDNFRHRYDLANRKRCGESADQAAATDYPAQFQDIVREGGYEVKFSMQTRPLYTGSGCLTGLTSHQKKHVCLALKQPKIGSLYSSAVMSQGTSNSSHCLFIVQPNQDALRASVCKLYQSSGRVTARHG